MSMQGGDQGSKLQPHHWVKLLLPACLWLSLHSWSWYLLVLSQGLWTRVEVFGRVK